MSDSTRGEITKISPADLSAVLHSGELPKPFSRNIMVWSGYLRGAQYQENIIQVTSKLEVGDRLNIFREPKNIKDEMAIFVKDKDGNRLGYIPRENNQILANLMDAGKSFYGIISEITHYESDEDENYEPWKMIRIELYMED